MRAAVIGAGNIGLATAGHLALLGHGVRLFEFPEFKECIREIGEKKFIEVESSEANHLPSGRAVLEYAGTDISAALEGADIVISAVPSYGGEKGCRSLFSMAEIRTESVSCVRLHVRKHRISPDSQAFGEQKRNRSCGDEQFHLRRQKI